MKFFFIFIIILPLVVCFNHNYYLARELGNPLKFLGKCLQDKECKPIEYCEHQGINPIGSCKIGKESNQTCVFDRHCKSKICHHLKCRLKKPVKDGPCSGTINIIIIKNKIKIV